MKNVINSNDLQSCSCFENSSVAAKECIHSNKNSSSDVSVAGATNNNSSNAVLTTLSVANSMLTDAQLVTGTCNLSPDSNNIVGSMSKTTSANMSQHVQPSQLKLTSLDNHSDLSSCFLPVPPKSPVMVVNANESQLVPSNSIMCCENRSRSPLTYTQLSEPAKLYAQVVHLSDAMIDKNNVLMENTCVVSRNPTKADNLVEVKPVSVNIDLNNAKKMSHDKIIPSIVNQALLSNSSDCDISTTISLSSHQLAPSPMESEVDRLNNIFKRKIHLLHHQGDFEHSSVEIPAAINKQLLAINSAPKHGFTDCERSNMLNNFISSRNNEIVLDNSSGDVQISENNYENKGGMIKLLGRCANNDLTCAKGPEVISNGESVDYVNCQKCEALFKSKEALQRHISADHVYECAICNTTLNSKLEYENHISNTHLNHNGRMHVQSDTSSTYDRDHEETESTQMLDCHACNHCDKKFRSKAKFNRHMLYHQGSKKFKCNSCGKGFIEKSSLKKHLETHRWRNILCENCGKMFKNKRTLQKHRLTHESRNILCEICGKVYLTKEGLQNHSSTHYINGSEHKCTECGKDCRSRKYLRLHMYSKHQSELKSNQYSCPECGKFFKWMQTLTHHRRLQHNLDPDKKRYTCSVCNKIFVNKYVMKHHMAKHDDARPHSCNICGDSFKYKHTKDNHLKIVHSDKREFQCSTCGKLFKTNTYLEKHIQDVHHSIRPINCLHCDKVFKTVKIMQNHVKVCHTKKREKKHLCQDCGRAFISPKDLNRHVKIHTGVKDHLCTICGRAFAREDNLKAHKKKHGESN